MGDDWDFENKKRNALMTWIKICGITNLEDARLAADAGADALGFVFYPRSPRQVNAAVVKEIVRGLAAEVETVGVFVDEEPDTMINVARTSGLKAIQWHRTDVGKPPSEPAHELGDLKMYCALPARRFIWESCEFPLSFPAVFLDSGTPAHPGGTGKTFDWSEAVPLVRRMSQQVHVVVAGGLNPENVAEVGLDERDSDRVSRRLSYFQ